MTLNPTVAGIKSMGDPGTNAGVFDSEDGESCVIQIRSEDGEGTMLMHQVFPGVTLSYNDFHMSSCVSEFETSKNLLCIDHCREGRIEQPVDGTAVSYAEAGDLKIDDRTKHRSAFALPLSHYHGITVSFDIDTASNALKRMWDGFPVDLYALKRKYCKDGIPYILHGVASVEHIFSALYAVPSTVRKEYFKVKILELLLFLDALELPEKPELRPYFYRAHVERVKAAHDFMCSDLSRHYTSEDLAERFGLSLTAFKSCFKGVYGMPPLTYMRVLRMNKAAVALRSSDASIASIAYEMGYNSASKFSAAFKGVLGETPRKYRNRI